MKSNTATDKAFGEGSDARLAGKPLKGKPLLAKVRALLAIPQKEGA